MTYPHYIGAPIPPLEGWELDELRDPDPGARELLLATTHPGFTIHCQRCGSDAVGVDSDAGWSGQSGGWGGVFLHCAKCDLAVYLWEAA